ncbi:MAG: MarR family transcriptional regulator [Lachnospiraceae bacterium]|nr:MarR family transcriptional regulator [Lachnospiraceae bacterium]MDE7273122.1 MarR family transcriptional regulator [Lachnospiraceae bacterium]
MEEFNSCCRNMPDPRKIGHMIRELNGAFKKKFITCGMAAGLDEVTLMHGWIMGYLYHNQERAIYQKTIESDFCIKRSTVTTILQLMEKKGYIRRTAVEGDARLKQIFLTEQGKEIAARTKEMIADMESTVIEGIAEDKLDVFYEVAQMLVTNMNQ